MAFFPVRFPYPWSPRTIGIAAAVVTVLIWASFIVVARASADPTRSPSLNPYYNAYESMLGAGLVLLPWGWLLTRRDARAQVLAGKPTRVGSLGGLSPLPLSQTLQVGLVGGLLYAVLVYGGFSFAPAAHASVLLPGSLPLWTALLALLVLGERITPARAIGLGLIVGGDALVGGASLLHAQDGNGAWRGDLLFVSASICWATYSVLVRKFRLDAVRATIAITALAFVGYVPLYTLLLALHLVPGHAFTAPLGDFVFQMVFQGLGTVVVSGMAFTRMIQYLGPVRSTMLTALVPGLSAAGAALVLGEPLAWNVVLGLASVTLGIVFGVQKSLASAPEIRATPAGRAWAASPKQP